MDFSIFTEALKNPNSIGAPVLVGGLAYILGFALKKSPIADWLIPIILLLVGGIVYPFIAFDGAIDPDITYPWVRQSIHGVCFTGVAVFGDQIIQQVKNRRKTPEGNTEIIVKDKKEIAANEELELLRAKIAEIERSKQNEEKK